MQTTLELTPDELQALADLCRRDGRSVESIVHEAVAALLARNSASSGAARRPTGFEEGGAPSWEDMDGLEFQRLVRSEW
jgi:hypothetical protein